jgi:hypothetical protein
MTVPHACKTQNSAICIRDKLLDQMDLSASRLASCGNLSSLAAATGEATTG